MAVAGLHARMCLCHIVHNTGSMDDDVIIIITIIAVVDGVVERWRRRCSRWQPRVAACGRRCDAASRAKDQSEPGRARTATLG
jgi:hypothetical protein